MSKQEKQNCPPHRYRRRNLTRNKDKAPYLVLKCMDCPHHKELSLCVGMPARCYHCNSEFIITGRHLTKAKIKCDNCIKRRKETIETDMAIIELMNKILSDL